MSFLSQFFAKRSSAPIARDRLQILLAHERSNGNEGQSELIAKLREEILEVIARHVPIDRDKVQIKLDRGAAVSTLEIDIEVPALKPGEKRQPMTLAPKPDQKEPVQKEAASKEAGPKEPAPKESGPKGSGEKQMAIDPSSGTRSLPTGP